MGIRRDYLGTFPIVRELVDAARHRWDDPSALADMTIGGLAAHTARSVTLVERYLDREVPPDSAVIDAPGYYASISGLGPDLDSEVNIAVRRRATADAQPGGAEILSGIDAAGSVLESRLELEPVDRRVVVLGGRVMLLDQYLITRLVEIVVHCDDLAVSLDADVPPFAHSAMDRVIECLVEVSRRSHGRLAVIRALSRRERDVVEALRVF